MLRSRSFGLVLITGLLAAATFGCSGDKPASGGTTTGAKPTTTTGGGTATSASPTPGGGAAGGPVGPPTVAAAPDAGFDAAKDQAGYADVKKLGKNPHVGDLAATEKGKALFAQNCASCHGDKGEGDGPAGAALDPKPRNQTAPKDYKYGSGDLGVFRTVKYGTKGTGMAPWQGRMTDDELKTCSLKFIQLRGRACLFARATSNDWPNPRDGTREVNEKIHQSEAKAP